MTAIRGYVAPTTEADALGVHSLDQFVLAVPDAARRRRTSTGNFGLDVQAKGNTLALKTFGHDHRWGSVVEGAKTKALHHLSFGCYADDLPRLKARIEGNGVKLIDPPPGFESNGFWFRNHEGVLIEIKVAPKVSPDQKSDSHGYRSPAGVAGATMRAEGAAGAAAPALACADLHQRHRRLDRLLRAQSRPAPVRPRRRPGRLHARHPRQRPSPAGAGEIVRARLPSLQLGRRQRQRHRPRRHAHGRQGLSPRAGASAATCSAPTTSTTCRIPGAASRNIPATSTTSRRKSAGRPPTTSRRNSFYLWGPEVPREFTINVEGGES